jgi:hypothetical protein
MPSTKIILENPPSAKLEKLKSYFDVNNVSKSINTAINSVVETQPTNCFGSIIRELTPHEKGPIIKQISVDSNVVDQYGKTFVLLEFCGIVRGIPDIVRFMFMLQLQFIQYRNS